MNGQKLLEVRGVSKRFGGALALDHVDWDLYAGEVHGLVGENGAGKSTLMKILSGYHSTYEGEIYIKGNKVRFSSTQDALAQGIGMIYQELSVIPTLSVGENIFLGVPPRNKAGLVDWKRLYREADDHLKQLGLRDVNVRADLSTYTVATRQMIEIARVIFSGANIIIMDEPTSALSHNEVQSLFEFIRKLKTQGKGIVFISHSLEDVLTITDRITVLRNGGKVMTVSSKEANKQTLSASILGKEQTAEVVRNKQAGAARPSVAPVLEVRGLKKSRKLHGINLKVSPGEILGVYGSMGAGKTQLAECLFGMDHPDSGEVLLDGKPVQIKNSSSARELGIAYVPANRQTTLFPSNEVYKNMTLTHLGMVCPSLLDSKREIQATQQQIDSLGVRPKDPKRPVSSLSGGNQQKVVLGKWLTATPKLLMLNDPTRGMDVGAKQEVMEIVEGLRAKGVATLLFSTEPELLMAHADRVVVLRRGEQIAELQQQEVTKDVLLSYS